MVEFVPTPKNSSADLTYAPRLGVSETALCLTTDYAVPSSRLVSGQTVRHYETVLGLVGRGAWECRGIRRSLVGPIQGPRFVLARLGFEASQFAFAIAFALYNLGDGAGYDVGVDRHELNLNSTLPNTHRFDEDPA
ncbi:uncharacterized protein N7482_004090 [Penicillium canariense]|uniref:Uncharacterized protein n=1 Tax=Penicillium canariense TaxID=189055 RepID=A0A9W9I7X6_9EURO|nr:uncharacterized protein N7482_004090 [Penicillium canariense]KAJ5168496.1 hypothetical protein N7482_004090 [Penicillium canariense]